MNNPDVILITPPFGVLSTPYISIPALCSYLKGQKISAAAYDLNSALYQHLLMKQSIREGVECSIQRFIELNENPDPGFSEMFEYRALVMQLHQLSRCLNGRDFASLSEMDFSSLQDSNLIKPLIGLITMPHYPEIIITEPVNTFMTRFDPFSSKEILEGAEQTGFYVEIFHLLIESLLSEYTAPVVGFSVVFSEQIIPAFQCARIIRKLNPGIHITFGGPGISIFFRNTRERKLFAYANSFILDDGELPLSALIRQLQGDEPDLSSVPGLMYCSENRIHCNSSAATPIQECPTPDYSVFDLDGYLKSRNNLTVPFRITKGCHWRRCTFCRTGMMMCGRFEHIDQGTAWEHLKTMIKETGIHSFMFSDESAPLKTLEFISRRLIEEDIAITWKAHTRISENLTRERLELFKKAGCRSLMFGVESLSDRILTLMDKGITAEMIDTVLTRIKGILPIGVYMMVGFPSETEQEAVEGYRKMVEYRNSDIVSFFLYSQFSIHYGSLINKDPEQFGITGIPLRQEEDLNRDIYNFTGSGMSRSTAQRLFKEFNAAGVPVSCKVDSLIINGVRVPLKLPLDTIGNILDAAPFDTTDMLLSKWIEQNDKRTWPIR